MVNKIPSYSISAGGRFAVLSSRSHPYASSVMAPACCDALESAGVATDDIYIIDAPNDLLLAGMSRELSKTDFYSAIVALAILPEAKTIGEAVLNGFTTCDFPVPVIPGLVTCNLTEVNELARIAQDAARSAIEMTNFAGMLDEMRGAVGDRPSGGGIELEELEEIVQAAPKRRRGRPRKAAASAVAAAPKRGRGRPAKAQAATGGKRRRGRPPKAKAASASSNNGSAEAPRRRGRPRKNA
jgi:6,7-dimethyl-8-ribityllumazine synthase